MRVAPGIPRCSKLSSWQHWRFPGAQSRAPNPAPATGHTGLGLAQKSGQPEHMRLGMRMEKGGRGSQDSDPDLWLPPGEQALC